VRPVFSFEVGGEITAGLQAEFAGRIVEAVQAINADFRTAMAEDADAVRPIVRLYPLGAGPFAADRARIKQTRLLRRGA
jgi:hypothetical protein